MGEAMTAKRRRASKPPKPLHIGRGDDREVVAYIDDSGIAWGGPFQIVGTFLRTPAEARQYARWLERAAAWVEDK